MKVQPIKVLIVLLVINLLINFSSSSRLNSLIDQVDRNKSTAYLEREVFDQLEYLKRKINDINEDLEYITDIDVAIVPKEKSIQTLKFNWQIKDYSVDSKVSLFYKVMDEDFTEIPVISKKPGSFEAEVQIELEEEPIWEIEYESEYDFYQMNNECECEYYVSINEGDRIVSSEIDSINLNDLMAAYNALYVEVETVENDIDHISIHWRREGKAIKAITAQMYSDKKLLEEIELEKRKDNWISWDVPDLDYNVINLRVEYEDGRVFEKEIWGKSVRGPVN